MRIQPNLFEILQNPAVGLIAIHSFILGYNNVAKNKGTDQNYPPLAYLFYVLPIVYDSKAVESMRFELYTTLSSNPSLTLGLQERANKMSSQTFDSLNLGFSKQVLALNQDDYTVAIFEKTQKDLLMQMRLDSQTLKDIRTASKKLGNIFAKKDTKMLQLNLNIRF